MRPFFFNEAGSNSAWKSLTTPREISRQSGAGWKQEFNLVQSSSNALQITLHEIVVFGPRQTDSLGSEDE